MENRQHAEREVAQQDGATTTDRKMEIRENELAWAHQIKSAVTADKNLNNLTDFEYAQWAIVTLARQDMDEVLERVYKQQSFLTEYRILQSPDLSYVEEGLIMIKGLMQTMPGYLLNIDLLPLGRYLSVLDQSSLKPSNFKTEDDWQQFLGGYYYILEIFNSNLSVIREGTSSILECMDVGFHNFSHYMIERLETNLFEFYPFKMKESMWLNTPTAANILVSIMRPFLPDEVKSSFKMGCKLEGLEQSIDSLFKVPTAELAEKALLVKLSVFLKERENNQLKYRLPPL